MLSTVLMKFLQWLGTIQKWSDFGGDPESSAVFFYHYETGQKATLLHLPGGSTIFSKGLRYLIASRCQCNSTNRSAYKVKATAMQFRMFQCAKTPDVSKRNQGFSFYGPLDLRSAICSVLKSPITENIQMLILKHTFHTALAMDTIWHISVFVF